MKLIFWKFIKIKLKSCSVEREVRQNINKQIAIRDQLCTEKITLFPDNLLSFKVLRFEEKIILNLISLIISLIFWFIKVKPVPCQKHENIKKITKMQFAL